MQYKIEGYSGPDTTEDGDLLSYGMKLFRRIGLVLVMLGILSISACGGDSSSSGTDSPSSSPRAITSIDGPKGHGTPQEAVRAFFDFLARGDYRAAADYVRPLDRQTYLDGVQKIGGSDFSFRIMSFEVLGFDGNEAGGDVRVRLVGEACQNKKCDPVAKGDNSVATLPMAQENHQWYLSQFNLG